MTEAAILRVCSVLANRLQLGHITPRVVGQFSNLVVAFDPLRIVARIATGTALLRDPFVFAQREVEIARFLAQSGGPVVAPCDEALAGPHVIDGWTIGLWRYVDILPELPDPVESGRRLAACHGLLRGYTQAPPLPYFGAFDELQRLLAHPVVHSICPAEDREMMERQASDCRRALEAYRGAAQPLHGDSHRKNVFSTSTGPLWADWEDTIYAPVEWDLACLVTAARINGTEQDRIWAEAALAAYGPHDAAALELCIHARALFGAAWVSLLAADNHAERRLQYLGVLLNWLRAQCH